MTDRELLELAAKAAGIGGEYCEVFQTWLRTDLPRGEDGGCAAWNPLADDGDALRLAVKLGMQVHINRDPAGFTASAVLQSPICGARVFIEVADVDIDAATRRAIVRAAAELGKSK